MLKELFPEELNVQNNNNMNNSMPSQPIPQPIPQETPLQSDSFSIKNDFSSPSEFSIPEVQVSQPKSFEMNRQNDNDHFKMNTTDNSFNADNSYSGITTNSNLSYYDNNGNFNNVNNYSNYGVFDYTKHAASDIKWKRLISVEIITSLLVCIIPIISIIIFLLVGQKNPSMATSIMSILTLAGSFVTAGLIAVLLQNFLDVKRNRNEGMFKGFNRLFPLWVVRFLVGLMIFGSLLIPAIPIIIYAINQNTTLFGILMFLAVIGMIVLDTWIVLRYNLANYLVIDGKSPIEAMRTSKKLMAGHKFQLLGLFLVFLGWYLVFYLFDGVLYTIFMLPLANEFNIVGLLIGWFFMFLATYILLLPLIIYFNMAKVEFYEDRINNGLNELRVVKKGKPILITLILSLVLTIISTGLMFLPGPKTSIQSLINQLAPIVESYGMQLNSGLPTTDPNNLGLEGLDPGNNIITEDPNTGGDVDTNGGGDIDLSELGSGLTKIKYSVPSGYTQSYVSNDYISYSNADWNDITLTYEDSYFDLKNYEDIYPGGEYKSIAGHDAYVFLYSFDDSDYKEYTCYLKGTKEDDGYYIRAEKEDAFNYVINSISF